MHLVAHALVIIRPTGGQQFLAGHTLASNAPGGNKLFTFPSNLPGDTLGKKMLLGTAGFAALGVVAPDYVLPDGFLQEHVLRGTAPDGSEIAMPACLVVTVRDGRFLRIHEYLDASQVAALSG